MGTSFLFAQSAHSTASSFHRNGQLCLVNSSSCSLLGSLGYLSQFGFEGPSACRTGSGSLGDNLAAFSRRSPKLRDSYHRSHGIFHSNYQQPSCNFGTADRTRRYVRFLITASTKKQEWQDYKDAVQSEDLAGALEVLDVLNSFESDAANLPAAGLISSTSSPSSRKDRNTARSLSVRPLTLNDLKILDACQMIPDLRQVGKAYELLFSNGSLPNFGREKCSAYEGERLVTEAILVDSIGLKASKLSPTKWGLSGKSAITLPIGIAVFSYIRDSGVDIRPIAALMLAVGFYDAIYLGGTGLVQLFSLWLPYKRRVLVHEAGHVLVAYLLGCPVRGVILDPVKALKMRIQGQAGTQFWDESLQMEFLQAGLPSPTVDRYSIVAFAGIAAEALIYGDAQGGESDENLFKSVIGQLKPSWSPAKMSNQARWAVLQAFQLLRNHKNAHAAVVQALEQEAGLGSLIRAVEEAIP